MDSCPVTLLLGKSCWFTHFIASRNAASASGSSRRPAAAADDIVAGGRVAGRQCYFNPSRAACGFAALNARLVSRASRRAFP